MQLDNRYHIENEVIGKGSFGVVVRAFDQFENRPVVVKLTKCFKGGRREFDCMQQI